MRKSNFGFFFLAGIRQFLNLHMLLFHVWEVLAVGKFSLNSWNHLILLSCWISVSDAQNYIESFFSFIFPWQSLQVEFGQLQGTRKRLLLPYRSLWEIASRGFPWFLSLCFFPFFSQLWSVIYLQCRSLRTLSYVRFGDVFTKCQPFSSSEKNFRLADKSSQCQSFLLLRRSLSWLYLIFYVQMLVREFFFEC